jgi:hypothetical protein
LHEHSGEVLLFSVYDEYSSLIAVLSDKQIPYISTSEPDIPDNMRLMMLLAISNSDLDNLLLCCKARHLFPDACLIALCNDMLYHSIFMQTGIQYILTGRPSPDMVISTVLDAMSRRRLTE